MRRTGTARVALHERIAALLAVSATLPDDTRCSESWSEEDESDRVSGFMEASSRRAQKAQKVQRQHCFQLYLHDRADEVVASFSIASLKQGQRLQSRLEG